jgi:hypothetical protein
MQTASNGEHKVGSFLLAASVLFCGSQKASLDAQLLKRGARFAKLNVLGCACPFPKTTQPNFTDSQREQGLKTQSIAAV